jgi:hypothetical protein
MAKNASPPATARIAGIPTAAAGRLVGDTAFDGLLVASKAAWLPTATVTSRPARSTTAPARAGQGRGPMGSLVAASSRR